MLTVRRSQDRGRTVLTWLDSMHTFSFADYHDDRHVHFGALRVINEDIVAPSSGFGAHPHHNMEIVTYVVSGELEHRDSMGNGSPIRAGEVQRMSAGTGVIHSEWNNSKETAVHLLQIWIFPNVKGLTPGYEQKKLKFVPNSWIDVATSASAAGLSSSGRQLEEDSQVGQALSSGAPGGTATSDVALLSGQDPEDRGVVIHQDASIKAARLRAGKSLSFQIAPERMVWLQIVKGAVNLNGTDLEAGDAAAAYDIPALEIAATSSSEMLLFDLPRRSTNSN